MMRITIVLLTTILLQFVLAEIPEQPQQCGIFPGSTFRDPLGSPVQSADEAPWQITFEVDGRVLCDAALISQNWFMTTAHCIDYIRAEFVIDPSQELVMPRAILARSFRAASPTAEDDGIRVRVENYFIHPNYNYKSLDFDFAIGHFTELLNISKKCMPICLLDDCSGESPAWTYCSVSGWGTIATSGGLATLHRGVASLWNRADCSAELTFVYGENMWLTERMTCASMPNGVKMRPFGNCLVDDGGPLGCFQPKTGQVYLQGVASFRTSSCDSSYAGAVVYSRPCSVNFWIKDVMESVNKVFFSKPSTYDVEPSTRPSTPTTPTTTTTTAKTTTTKDVNFEDKYADVDILKHRNGSSNSFPWYGRVVAVTDSASLQPGQVGTCGSALVDSSWLLTTASCLNRLPTRVLIAKMNITDTTSTIADGLVRREIVQIVEHPQYSAVNFDYDFALLKLQTPVAVDNSFVRTVSLLNNCGPLADGMACQAVGWALIDPYVETHRAIYANKLVLVESARDCRAAFDTPSKYTPRKYCGVSINNASQSSPAMNECQIGYGSAVTCVTPETAKRRSRVALFGLASSFPRGCGDTDGNYIVAMSAPCLIKDWIDNVTM